MVTFRAPSRCRCSCGAASSALRSGATFAANDGVDLRTDVDELTVERHGPFPYQVDGDYLGETDQLEFRHEPDILRPRHSP